MAHTVFIDGSAGTTGLRIAERLRHERDIHLLTLPEARRKDLGGATGCGSGERGQPALPA